MADGLRYVGRMVKISVRPPVVMFHLVAAALLGCPGGSAGTGESTSTGADTTGATTAAPTSTGEATVVPTTAGPETSSADTTLSPTTAPTTTTDPTTTGGTTIETTTGMPDTCMNGALDPDETDLDCGGPCPACGAGQACLDNPDCATTACVAGVCVEPACLADADCDGQDGPCADAGCDLATFTCTVAPIDEGMPCDPNPCATSMCATGTCAVTPLAADSVVCDGATSKTCDGGGGVAEEAACPEVCIADVGCEQACVADHKPCASHPRIMVLLEASSTTLNLDGMRAKQGQGVWEEVRQALAGTDGSLFAVDIPGGELATRAYLGLAVFGLNIPNEAEVLVQYGACKQPNFAWALDPVHSCVGPDCVDPYADSPITWTKQDGMSVPPFFATSTISHMPRCNAGPMGSCSGSGAYTHLGLEAVRNNIAAYKAQCVMDPQEPCDPATPFINILIASRLTNSTPGEYTPPLMQMYADGVVTHVIGYGPGADSPAAIASLNFMADQGSGDQLDYHDANNPAELAAVFADIVASLAFPGC